MRLLDFKEKIDTECRDQVTTHLSCSAIKVDGDGKSLKYQLGLNNVASCDYLRFGANSIILLECSDLFQQQTAITKAFDFYNTIPNAPREAQNALKKSLKFDTIYRQEFQKKCIGTLLIIYRLLEKLGLSTSKWCNRNKIFVIAVCVENRAENAIFFNHLKNTLKSSLPDMVEKVVIVGTHELESYLSKTA